MDNNYIISLVSEQNENLFSINLSLSETDNFKIIYILKNLTNTAILNDFGLNDSLKNKIQSLFYFTTNNDENIKNFESFLDYINLNDLFNNENNYKLKIIFNDNSSSNSFIEIPVGEIIDIQSQLYFKENGLYLEVKIIKGF